MMRGSRIGRLWLMNSLTWPVTVLSAFEVVVKALTKDKNNILHARLGHIGESHNKRISHMVDDIDIDPSKIWFCEACIEAKITRNSSKKPIPAVMEKLKRVYMDLWGPALDISLQGNRYMWTATDQVTGRV